MAWVRAGGVLYDRQGRRDDARTEELRAEIRLQDEEKRVMEQWNAYEDRWRILLATDTPVAFADVPWPLSPAPVTASELTSEAVEKFLFAPLNVRQNTVTKRERIRASLLRWHPDKVSAVLQRVVEGDADAVRNGVNTVFLCLRALQDKDRQLCTSDV
ncbi:hypothetical protein WOLCODRAFT_27147 [Wolfiporia cocos MD-104 SS10]|uniref:Uncharacterized protein n=1 Tax=Wolfiporia cocos (strain MD-104) TaxID=742152 RepID=A0A2H3JSK3_WOLCO|nr:hypothetical protein WOLCODRAFT_27147 [Wolfiporia cocos MD-104 SS10]